MSSVGKIKKVMLVTENRKSDFSRKVVRAARLAKKSLVVEEANFAALNKILDGKVGVVVVDRDELKGVADHFFRSIRMFRSHTPVLMPFSKKLILEQMFTQAHERNVTTKQLAQIMTKAAIQSKEFDKAVPMTYSFEKDIQLTSLADLIVRSLKFDKALDKVHKKFGKEINKIKHLTGDELTIALEKIRKDAFSSPEFKHMQVQIKKRVEAIARESQSVH
jgi:hypothetical protein